MQNLNLSKDPKSTRKVLSAKRRYGARFGAVAGLAFALAAWGIDALQLSAAHAYYPWLKLVVGLVCCIPLGWLAGRIAARADRSLTAVIIWVVTAGVFSWLTVALPFQIAPALSIRFNPALQGLLHYTVYDEFQTRLGVGVVWMLIFGALIGVLQLPMSEPAVVSTSSLGRILPLLVCAILMFVPGYIIDSLNNEPLRNGLISIDTVIQYSLDHEGQAIDPQTARDQHLSVLRNIQDLVHKPRHLIVGKYDKLLGQIDVIVGFGDTYVDCTSFYEQPTFCKPVAPATP